MPSCSFPIGSGFTAGLFPPTRPSVLAIPEFRGPILPGVNSMASVVHNYQHALFPSHLLSFLPAAKAGGFQKGTSVNGPHALAFRLRGRGAAFSVGRT